MGKRLEKRGTGDEKRRRRKMESGRGGHRKRTKRERAKWERGRREGEMRRGQVRGGGGGGWRG